MSDYEDEENDPAVIHAKADAEVKVKEAQAKVLEARAKLHPAAQVIYVLGDQIGSAIGTIGCLLIIGVVVVAIFAGPISLLLHGGR